MRWESTREYSCGKRPYSTFICAMCSGYDLNLVIIYYPHYHHHHHRHRHRHRHHRFRYRL